MVFQQILLLSSLVLLLGTGLAIAFSSSATSTATPLPPGGGHSWFVQNAPWQLSLYAGGSQLYVFGDLFSSSTALPTLKVYNASNGTVENELRFATGTIDHGRLYNQHFLIVDKGDVVLRSEGTASFSFTSTALQRFSIESGKLQWETPVETTDTGSVGALGENGYVYTTVGEQLRVIDVSNGTFVSSISLSSNSSSVPFTPLVANPRGTSGWLVVQRGSSVQGYSLVDPTCPTLAWTATDVAGTVVEGVSNPQVSQDGGWIVGTILATTNSEFEQVATGIAVIDVRTGGAQTRPFNHAPTVFGSSETLALVATTTQHAGVVATTYGTLNLTTLAFVEAVRPHVVGGNVQCGLATDGSVFVCGTATGTSLSASEISFTVFDATTSGAMKAQFSSVSLQSFPFPPSVDLNGGPLTVTPSADGLMYNVYFKNDYLAMLQVPRTKP